MAVGVRGAGFVRAEVLLSREHWVAGYGPVKKGKRLRTDGGGLMIDMNFQEECTSPALLPIPHTGLWLAPGGLMDKAKSHSSGDRRETYLQYYWLQS